MKLGGLDISTVKLGASQVQAIYQGPNLVWQNAPVATAATGVGQTSFTANWEAYTGAVVYLLDVSTSPTFDTFIYENQEVNAPSTSYVVIGLESNTTYYYRVRASDTDLDAQAFFDRVTTAGGTLSVTEQQAVNQLVLDMKADGSWTKMKAIYPMVGASAAACAQNLKSASFTGTFTVTGWTFASTGVQGDASSAYFDTGLNSSSNLTKTSAHLSVYVRNNTNNGSPYDIGNAENSGMTTNPTYLITRYLTDKAYIGIADGSYGTSASSTDSTGFWCGGTNGSLAQTLYRNGSSFTTKTAGSGSFANNNLYIGAANAGGSASFFTDKEYAFASIGDGLSATEASDFYTAVQAFQTTLGRQV